jgi:predicted AAA+ superfamily ATPase
MNQELVEPLKTRLAQKLAESLSGPLPNGTPRRVHGTLALPGKATAIIGMRRAGKTMLLHQLRRERLSQGIPRERLPHINFEDELLAGMKAKDLHLLLEEYYRRFPQFRGKEVVTWCLDEIQTVPGWERFVRRVLDSEKVEIFLSGSSAALLSREIATSMRGRAWEVIVHPFSFEEYLRHHGQAVPAQPDFLTGPERSLLERHFLDYLAVGGFPEAQGLDIETRRMLLHDYVDVAMLRDIVERHNVTNVAGLRRLVRHLLGNAGSLFSVTKLYSAFTTAGLAISRDTLHQLLDYLEDCFLVRTLWLESGSERQRMVNPRKAYPVDPGLIPVFDRSMRPNTGHALETVVLLELERRRMSVTYVRTEEGHEVDFLARSASGETELIQVCANASGPEVLEREMRALEEAGRQYPKATRRLLTATQDGFPQRMPQGIVAQPAYEWLLRPGS